MYNEPLWPNISKSLDNNFSSSVFQFESDELIIRSKDGLRFFKYNHKCNGWQQISKCDTRFSDKNKFNQPRHKLSFFKINDKNYVSFLTIKNGYVFLELDKKNFKFKHVANDRKFIRKYDKLEFGYFYGPHNPLGLFSYNHKNGALFHFVNLTTPKNPIIRHEKTNIKLKENFEWKFSDANFYFTNVNGNETTSLVVQHHKGLSVYELRAFNDYFKPIKLFDVPLMAKKEKKNQNEKFYFARVTPVVNKNSFFDLVTIEFDGLRVFKWFNDTNEYRLINFSDEFSEENNWNVKYSDTILFSDFDSSGVQKLVYSGPKGLRIEKLEKYGTYWIWNQMINFEFNENVNEKYLVPIEIIPLSKSPIKKPILIGNDLINKKTVFIPFEEQNFNEKNDESEIPNSISKTEKNIFKSYPLIQSEEIKVKKSILPLSNMFDMKSIMNSCINPSNGQLILNLPLIKLPFLEEAILSLNYASTFVPLNNSCVGLGWSLSQDFIFADFKSNKFAHQFYLITKSSTTSLHMNKIENDEILFKIENDKEQNLIIKYNIKKCQWIVENVNEKIKKSYGGGISSERPNGNGIEWKNNWFRNKQFSDKPNHPFKWYLTNLTTESDRVYFEYNYKKTTSITKIKSDKNDTLIEFNYDQNHILTSYNFKTKNHIQNIEFNYEMENNDRLLKSIIQKDNHEKVLEFVYEKISNSMKISKIIFLDRNDSLNFTYEDASQKVIENNFSYLLNSDLASHEDKDTKAQLSTSIDYSILSYTTKSKSKLILTILTQEGSKFGVEIKASETYKNGHFSNYKILSFHKHFVVYLLDSKSNEDFVYLCKIQSIRKEYENSKIEVDISDKLKLVNGIKSVSFGSEFIALINLNDEFSIIELIENEWTVSFSECLKSSKALMSMNEDQNILIYNNTNLNCLFKDQNSKWQSKLVTCKPGLLTALDNSIDCFDLSETKLDGIKQFLKKNFLHFSKNIILLNKILVKNDTMSSELLVLLTDDEFNIINEQTLENKTLSFSDSIDFELKFSDDEVIDTKIYHFKQGEKYVVGFEKQEKTFDFKNGNKVYKRTYKLENQDILTTIIDHHGYDVEIKDNKKCVKDDFKDAFLIDIESFHVSLTPNRISCKEKLFDLNSESWTVTQIENDKKEIIKISDKFKLFKDSTSWQLYSNNKLEFDFKTDSLDNIQVSYPYYIAYMSDSDKSVKILSFENDSIGKEVFITKADYVLPGGNAYLFGIKESMSYRIKFFTIPAQSIFHVRIIEKTIILDKQKYRKIYEYDDKSSSLQNGVVLYSKFKTIPAGDSSKHGYIQYDLSTEIKYFNSDGKVVKIDKETTDNEEDEIENNQKNLNKKQSVLYAKDGKSEIVDFYNLDINSDEADYIGFEVYEKSKNWIYDQSSCVRNEWPLTGNSFLRLKKSSISKEFKPGKFIFECSCWVRISNVNNFEIGKDFEDFFLLIVETGEKFSSKVTSIYQDWLFLTVDIDIQNRNVNSIKCVISTEKYEHIDVDHIKWIRKNGRFQISTYDESCSLLISQLDETNTIKKIFYDDSYQPLALIDSNNHLLQTSFTYNLNKTMLQIEALNAFYETFSDYELNRNWSIDEPNDWFRNQKCLVHKNISNKSSIRLRQQNMNLKSLAMYFNIELSSSSELSLEINFHRIKFKPDQILVNDVKIQNLADGFYFVIVEAKRVILWNEKKLLIDRKFNNLSESTEILFSSHGLTKLSNVIVLNDPLIKVNHYNSIGQLTQSIQLIDDSSVIIKQDIYDECMRESIETKPTQLILKDNEQSLAYRDDFVTNYFFDSPTNVWSTKKLLGKISDLNPLDKGFSYRRKIYSKDPLNYIESIDFPDKLLMNKEAFVYSNKSYEYFESLFPVENGFVNKASIELNGNRTIKVYDKNNNMVALFNHTLGFKDILTTYEFDKKNNLVKILPPLFHANVFTLDHVGLTYEEINSKWNSDKYYQNLQKQFGSFYVYDDKTSSLIESCTPEQGKQIYVYNKFGFLRFNLKYDSNERPFILEYSNYNNKGEVCEKGFTKNEKFFDIKFLKSIADSDINELSDTVCMQESISTVSTKPGFNGKQVFSYVKNSSNNFEYNDKVCYSDKDKMLKKVVNLKRMDGSSCLLRMQREYSGDRLNSIVYPFSYQDKIMKLNYGYNKQGLVSSISIDDKQIASFDYTPSGNLNREALLTNLDQSFTRNYSYNSSDLLTSQDDCFIKESLSYSENGYECENKQFDTSISKTIFYPKWYEKCDIRSLCLNEDILIQKLENLNRDEANYLLNNLVELGVLNEEFKVLRNLTLSEGLVRLPIKYDEYSIKKLMSLLNENFPLNPYGHQYSYGSHSELVNSKYFIGEENFKPINNKSFVIDNKNNLEKSDLIWNVLIKTGCIIPQINEGDSKFGKVKNNEWIDTKSLEILLKNSNYTLSLTKKLIILLVYFYSKRQILTKDLFCSIYIKWFQFDDQFKQIESEIHLELGAKLWDILATNNYLYDSDRKKYNLFKNEFYLIISENGLVNTLPEIIGILIKYNDNQIGSSSCDVRSYNTDANGNHKLFHVGFDRIQFNYNSNSNQISSIENEGQTYRFEYDSIGNVTTAEHKGIVRIIYDEISNRPVRFILKNGQIVDLGYDSMNERVYKCVLDKNDKKVKEILYFRDNTGRCLVEKEIFYDQNEQFRDEYYTAYVYGPKGLVGYIRNDEFYNVITDHEQSVRLVVKNMEVIAAYDYLPYGQLIRNFGTKTSQLRYRFTGQEWDEELGLYNYHARLYDPTIGRFYQVDEKEQYASPYKYAGNSPVSMYDPDGNLAFIVVIGFVAVGAYLGGAAAMDDWAFWNWEWDNWNLYMGMFFGSLTGFFLPFGFVAASTVIGGIGAFIGIGMVGSIAITALLGILGAYFAMSSSMGTFNPCKWKWIKPGLWNAAFQGFSSAVQLPNAFSNFAAIYKKSFSKFLTFLALGSVTAAGMAYLNVASINNSYNPTKWKMNQRTVIGMINGAISGFFLPFTIANIYGFYSKDFPEITKNLVEKLGKLGYWLAYGSLSLIVITPVIFLFALKQGMNCSWSDLIKTPAFLETLISGLLVGLSMPNILLKAIPKTMKIYREGILEFYDRTINAKLIENDQKLAKLIADEVNEKCAEKLSNNVKNSEAYRNASEETKQLVDKYLDNCRQDLMTTGKLRPIKEFLNDLLKILDERNQQNGLVNTKTELKTLVENMDLDQQKKDVYLKLIDEVTSQLQSASSDPKGLGGSGVYSVVRLKDGRSIVCHSGSKEIYAMFNADGSRVPVDEMNKIFPSNTNLAAQVPVETMDYADQVSADTNRTKPHASNCGEFRSIYIIANLKDIPTDQILSISAFKSENANLEPVLRCKNCQVTTNMVKEPLVFTDSKINRETPNQIDRGYTRLNDGSIVLYDIETRNVIAIYDANANRIYGPNVQNVEFFSSNLQPKYTSSATIYEIFNSKSYLNTFYIQEIRYDLSFTNSNVNWTRFQDTKTNSKWTLAHLYKKLAKNKKD